jgi:ring-1,2-phenylacetyl-CoA epoxidase subunit PaaE
MSPRWQVPLRFLVGDFGYMHYYLKRIRHRPKAEWRGLAYSMVVFVGVLAIALGTGHLFEWLVLYILPARVMLFLLAWGFDWLPHHGLRPEDRRNRFKTTRNIVGAEWLLTPLFFYHNYHLVHHVHPKVPFYKYLSVWARNEASYLAREPALSTVTGRTLSPEEYRARKRTPPGPTAARG